jgi:hypothetical protein
MKPIVVLGMAQPYPGYGCEQVTIVASRIPDTIVAFGQTLSEAFRFYMATVLTGRYNTAGDIHPSQSWVDNFPEQPPGFWYCQLNNVIDILLSKAGSSLISAKSLPYNLVTSWHIQV